MQPLHAIPPAAVVHNAKIALDISQIWLCVFMAISFSLLSYVVYRIKGKSPAYYVSQMIGLSFVMLAMIFLAAKLLNHV